MKAVRHDLAPGVALLRRDERYPVVGSTLEELTRAQLFLGPAREGQVHVGWTAWEIEWNYVSRHAGAGWSASEIKVTVNVCVTLPRWHAPRNVDARLHERWERYLHALEAHEEGHVVLLTPTALAVQRALREIAPRTSREALDACAHETVDAIVAAHQALDRSHDECTRTQGIPSLMQAKASG